MRLLAAAVILGLLNAPARAADAYREGRFDFGAHPGFAVPVGATSDFMRTAWGLTFAGDYQIDDLFSVGAELGFQFKHSITGRAKGDLAGDYDGDGVIDDVPFDSDLHSTIMNFTPVLKVGPWLEAFNFRWRPYGVGGAGLYQEYRNSGTVKIQGVDAVNGKQVGPIYLHKSGTSNSFVGLNVGGGFDIQVDENAALGFDLRYERVFRPVFNYQFIHPTFRVYYLF